MYKCYQCSQILDCSLCYKKHYASSHPSIHRYLCYESSCNRVYSNINKHINHILKGHLTLATFRNPNSTVINITSQPNLSISNYLPSNCQNIDSQSSESASEFSDISRNFLKTIVKLLADERLPRTTAIHLIADLMSFYSNHIKTVLSKCSYYINVLEKKELTDITTILKSLLTPSYVKSEYLLFKKLKEIDVCVQYETYNLCTENYQAYSTDNHVTITSNQFFTKIINLHKLYGILFSKTPILKQITDYIAEISNNNSAVINIIQSPLWKLKVERFNSTNSNDILLLPLMVYFDDFEPLNPLGSHSGMLKLGAVYVKIMCLPDYLSSKLSHIILSMVFFSQDRSKFGNTKIFKPLIEQLNKLQTDGIKVNFQNYTTVKLITCIITGDNLGVNSILGFTESFSSNFFCRFCKEAKSESRFCFEEKTDKLRNVSNYKEDLITNNVSETGIKENSVWNNLSGFHVTDNMSVDCFHDILEGICHYDLICILKNFIIKKLFSLQELNRRIQIFNFGSISKNKPPLLSNDCLNKNKIRLSGSEMLTLFKYFPFIIGDMIPHHFDEWKLFLKLREIICIIFRKHHHKSSATYFRHLVAEHNYLYTQVSQEHLKPKFHILSHYARILDNIGPIVSINSMRFEAKHQIFKKNLYLSNNRKNILESLVKKYQINFANMVLSYTENFDTPIKHATLFNVTENLHKLFNFAHFDSKLKQVSSLSFFELELKVGLVVCIGEHDDGDLAFALIKNLLILDKNIFLCLQGLQTLFFDKDYFAYRVEKANEFFTIKLESLYCKNVSDICTNAEGYEFVLWEF